MIENNSEVYTESISTSNLKDLRNYVSTLNESRKIDKILNIGMDIIDHSAFYLKLNESIKSEAVEVYEHLCSRGIAKGRSLQLLAITSIYVVCRKHYLPITISDIALVTDANKKDIARTLRVILNKANIHLPILKPGIFVERYSQEVEASKITQKLAETMLSLAYERHLVAGRDPTTVAAALIYSASRYTSDYITQETLAKRAMVTPVSIRNYCKYFSDNVDEATIKNLLIMVKTEEVPIIDDSQKVWNKYLVSFILSLQHTKINKTLNYAFSNITHPDAKFSQIYLQKSSITQKDEENARITLTLWVNVSTLYSYAIPQDLNFRINEIYGSEAVLQVDTKFLDSINADSSELPSFFDSSQVWNTFQGDQISNISTGFDSRTFHPSSMGKDILSLEFLDILDSYRAEDNTFDRDLIEKTLINYQEKYAAVIIIEKCRESYYSNEKDVICFSLLVLLTLTKLNSDFSWRRSVADDLYQIYFENEDEEISTLIEETLKSLKYEETFSYEEILSVLDLGIEESSILMFLREKPGDLYYIAENNDISEVKARKIIDWLLREGFALRIWEGLSLSYSAIGREELLKTLREEYVDTWGGIPLP